MRRSATEPPVQKTAALLDQRRMHLEFVLNEHLRCEASERQRRGTRAGVRTQKLVKRVHKVNVGVSRNFIETES